MNSFKKMIRFLDRITDIGIVLFFLCLFFIGLYALYDSYLVYHAANNTDLLNYKPGYESESEQKPIQGNMVAWITLDETKVDYPEES